MKFTTPAAIAAAVLAASATVALSPAANAQGYQARTRYAPPPPEAYLTPDEARDYARDQLERRQEIERDALRMRQKAELRARGLDDDGDDLDD